MADLIQMGAYRLVALTYNGGNPDKGAAVSASRMSILYAEKPLPQLATFRVKAVVSSTRSPDLLAAVAAGRAAILYAETPLLKMATYRMAALVSTVRFPDNLLVAYAGRLAFLIKHKPLMASAGRLAYLIEQLEPGVPTYVREAQMLVAQNLPVPALNTVISKESAAQVRQLVAQKSDPLVFPWSMTRAAQAVMLVAQRRPITTQSYEKVPQVRQLVSARFNYTIPEDVWSKMRAGQTVMLVAQSLDIPYQPTSGEFVRQQRVLVAQQSDPMPMWTSPASVKQNVMLVAQKRPVERLPRSNEYAPQVTTLVATSRGQEQMPYSFEKVPLVTTLVSTAAEMPEPIGVQHTAELRLLVSQQVDYPTGLVGSVIVPLQRVLVSQPRVEALPISRESVPQVVTLVASGTEYPNPHDMVYLHTQRMRMLVSQQTDYPPASTPSSTVVPLVRALFITQPPASLYPPPGDVYEQSKKAMVPQFVELVSQQRLMPLPISYEQVPQLQMVVSQRAVYPTPEEMANAGVFVRQVMEQVALVAEYPKTETPQSTVEVAQLIETVAVKAQYPDAHLPVNYAILTQVVEHVAVVDAFPDPADMVAPLNVLQVVEQTGVVADYPDAGALHAPVVAYQLSGQVAVVASFPDKDSPQSFVEAMQVTQQTAFRANYPSKDLPQSYARALQVRQQVALRDLNMYQLPKPPRRHRVRVTFRFVY